MSQLLWEPLQQTKGWEKTPKVRQIQHCNRNSSINDDTVCVVYFVVVKDVFLIDRHNFTLWHFLGKSILRLTWGLPLLGQYCDVANPVCYLKAGTHRFCNLKAAAALAPSTRLQRKQASPVSRPITLSWILSGYLRSSSAGKLQSG